VHGVHLDDSEMELLARSGSHIAHCPTSNLKLASGIAPVADLLRHGVNVGLGTDGAASNNRLDLFGEMRLASLLAKGSSGDAAALPASQALRMATLNGARALGIADETGSIAPGKAADLCAVDLGGLDNRPCYDPSRTSSMSPAGNRSPRLGRREMFVEDKKLAGFDRNYLESAIALAK
jgi:5-methylthioadenosine/S-adenosylhomocysteine deaminase